MTTDIPPPAAPSVGRRLYAMLTPFPAVCFIAALVTDIAYARTASGQWETFSIWLLAAGLLMALLALVVGLVDWFADARGRGLKPAWPWLIANAVAVLLSLVNAFVHSRDAEAAVMPTGLTLSIIVGLILLVTGWAGWGEAYRRPAGGAL